MSYVIRCWYGNTVPNALYASGIKTRADAEQLRQRAISLGYLDAEVLSEHEYKAIFAPRPRSQASAGRAAREGRPV